MRRLSGGIVIGAALIGSLALVQTMIRGSQIMSHTVTATQLDTTGVTAATYGDSSHIGAFTVGADGRLSAASNVAVNGLPATSAKGDLLASTGSVFQVQGVGTDGQVLTADSTQTRGVKWATASSGSGGATAITASVFNSANQTLTSGTEATLAFDSEDYDASAMHDPVTNNSRLTVPTSGAGVYTVTARVKFTAAFAGAVHLRFYKNSALVTENTATGADLSASNEYHQASANLSLVATDFVEVKILVELSAGSGTISTVSGTGNTQFQAIQSAQAAQPGTVLQVVNVESGAVATGTTVIPLDDTIPQNTEGDQYLSLAITPKSATSKLKIDVVAQLSHSVANTWLTAALFQDTTANAIAANVQTSPSTSGNIIAVFTHWMTAGTTSATTFKLRCGGNGAGTTTFNGRVSARLYGGVMASSLTITEIAQ